MLIKKYIKNPNFKSKIWKYKNFKLKDKILYEFFCKKLKYYIKM